MPKPPLAPQPGPGGRPRAWRGLNRLVAAVLVGTGWLLPTGEARAQAPPAVPALAHRQPPLLLPALALQLPRGHRLAAYNQLVGRLPGFFINRPAAASAPAAVPNGVAAPVLAAAVPSRLQPIIVLNAHLIISYAEFGQLNPADIQKLAIYNDPAKTPALWSSLAQAGVVVVTETTTGRLRYKSRRLASFRRPLGLPRSVRYALNGQPLPVGSWRITRAAFGGLDIVRDRAAAPVLNIRVAQDPPSAPSPAQPGSPAQFYIRGLAGL